MIRHAKAPSAGSTSGRGRRIFLALAASFALALTLAPAALATAYSPIGEFGGSGTGNGLFSTTARRLAVDSSTGYVFAADAGNNRVQVFKPTACAPKCAEFLLKFPSPSPLGLAVDSSTGDVYTTHPAVNEKQIVELSAASSLGGTYKLSFGGQATGWTGSGTLNATTTVSGVSTTTGNLSKGEEISGTGIQAGTTISNFTATTITLSKAATGSGTVSLGSDLLFSASSTFVKEALEKLPAIGTGNVTTGGSGSTSPVTREVSFSGALAAQDVAQMTCDGSGLTGTGAACAVTTNVDGAVAGITKYNPVPSHANPTSYAKDPSFTSPAQGSGAGQVGAFSTTAEVTGPAAGGIAVDPTTHDILLGDLGASEVQALTVSAAAGQFRLKIGGQATGWTGSGTLNATTTVSGVSTTTGNLSKGEEISGTGIQAGTTISNFTATTITLSKAATGSGTVSLGSDLLFSASSTFVKEALEKLPAIGTGNVTVSGGPGNAAGSAPYVLSFQGSLANADVEQIAIENGATPLSGGTGTTSSTTTSGGVASQVKRFTSAGAFLSAFNGSSSGSAFKEVQDLAVNGQGEVVVADRVAVESTRIVHLDANGANATILGPVPNITGSGSRIVVAADPTSNDVFVSSRAEFLSALKVYRFDAGDAFVESPELTGTAGANTFGLASSGGASPRLYALVSGGTPTVQVLEAPTHNLTVAKTGGGTGTVNSSPSGINCGATCSAPFGQGTTITLTPAAGSGSEFTGWSGACSGTGTCEVTMSADKSVSANFAAVHTLTVAKTGGGTGTVSSSPSGINCGATCSAPFNESTTVSLTPTADSGSEFTGWSGACSGTGTCEVTLSADKSVSANFGPAIVPQHTLTVAKTGGGTGTVTSSPSGINCGATCSAPFNENTLVTLTPAAASGSTFTGWSGACSGTGTCEVTMSADKSVSANFAAVHTLTVAKTGGGTGTVTSSPSGINCGATCSALFNENTLVTLTPAAASGSTFTGWSGACSGTGACEVTMSADKSVSANFAAVHTLTVAKTGGGTGTVTSSPSGINCGATCSAPFNENTLVTLTPAAASGSTFTGWSGACSGTGTCEVTISADKSVSANFIPITHTLTVSRTGSGSGTVTSSPSGINCGATCAAPFNEGAVVTLTAAPASNSTFTGWSGACSGTGTCEVTISADKSVSAGFAAIPAPTATTDPEGAVTQDTAVLNGHLHNHGAPAGSACAFQVTLASDLTYSEAVTLPCTSTPVTGDVSTAVTATTNVLAAKTDYIYRLRAISAGGTVSGASEPFSTLPNPPGVSGGSASAISQTKATLNAMVDPNRGQAGCQFEWGTDSSYGHIVDCATDPGSGPSSVAVASKELSGLSPNTTYHFRVVATNAGGTTHGADHTFSTLADSCQTNQALCPPAPGGGGGTTPNPQPKPKPLTCKKGFKKVKAKGKARCVKVKKHHHKAHHHRPALGSDWIGRAF